MDKIISYTDNIKKYVSGKEYSGKNIQTTDGKIAYITETGIAKPYNSANSLSNGNGCTNELQQIGSAWGDMGIPVGSLMVDGQSCGNETTYVQTLPPDVNFDWQYFRQAHPELNIQSEQQAYTMWEIENIEKQGLLPNPHFLTDMANVGKIGYIDINTTLHPVEPTSFKHSGEYKIFNSTPAIGANMQDCIVPPPSVKYGAQLVIKYQNQYGSVNSASLLEFGNDRTTLYLRPPPDFSTQLDGKPISYGSTVNISATSSNASVPDCGWYGCKVGFVNNSTTLLSFYPGGENPTQFRIDVVPGTNYQYGTELKYGNPFLLTAIIEFEWSKQANINYAGNDINQSIPQPPKWSFWRGWVNQPSQSRPVSIKPLAECQNLCASTEGCVGIVTDTAGQNQCYLKNKFSVAGNTPIFNTYMLSSAANAVQEIPNKSWSEQALTDYGGNDISHTIKSLDDCKTSCAATIGCEGIVTDNSGQNHCWLKNKFGNANQNKDRNTYMLSVPVQIPPFEKTTTQESVIGCVYYKYLSFKNGVYGSENVFTFESVTEPVYIPKCNPTELQQKCSMDANCSGFIHSAVDNTWQKIPTNSTPEMFKVTNPLNPPNIYVKDMSVDNSEVKFIDSTMYSHYPKDNNFANINGNPCDIVDCSEIQSKQQQYNQANQTAAQYGEEMVKNNPNIIPYIKKSKNMYTHLNTKTKEYKNLLHAIKREKNNYNNTNEQQKTDLDIMQNSNKIHVFLWGLSSIIVISMVVMIKNKQ